MIFSISMNDRHQWIVMGGDSGFAERPCRLVMCPRVWQIEMSYDHRFPFSHELEGYTVTPGLTMTMQMDAADTIIIDAPTWAEARTEMHRRLGERAQMIRPSRAYRASPQDHGRSDREGSRWLSMTEALDMIDEVIAEQEGRDDAAARP